MKPAVHYTNKDKFRRPTDIGRPMMKEDMDKLKNLLEIAMLATLPADTFIMPTLTFQSRDYGEPASLYLMPFNTGMLKDLSIGYIAGMIEASIIKALPLRIFTGVEGGDLKHSEIATKHNPAVISAHQRIQHQQRAREVFGLDNPIVEHMRNPQPC